MKESTATTRLEVSAEVYWELRMDNGFDDYCAEAEGATYSLLTSTDVLDAAGDREVHKQSVVVYEGAAVPAPMKALLGSEPLRLPSTFRFWPDLYDEAHPCTYETRPSVLEGKLLFTGSSWVEPVSDSACLLHSRSTVEANVFGGSVLESALLRGVKSSFNGLSGLTLRYLATEAYAAGRSPRGRELSEASRARLEQANGRRSSELDIDGQPPIGLTEEEEACPY